MTETKIITPERRNLSNSISHAMSEIKELKYLIHMWEEEIRTTKQFGYRYSMFIIDKYELEIRFAQTKIDIYEDMLKMMTLVY